MRGVECEVYVVTNHEGRIRSIWTTLEAAELARRRLDDQGFRGNTVHARALQFDTEARL